MSVMTTAEKASYDALVSGAAQAVKKDGSVAFTVAQSGVAPTSGANFTTRDYVDSGVVTIQAVTAAALPAYTITSGSVAAGTAVFTANANGAFPTLDASAVVTASASEAVSSRFLLSQGASNLDNCVLTLTTQGSAGTAWVASMYSGLNTSAKIVGSKLRVIAGEQCAGAEYVHLYEGTFTLGTTPYYPHRVDARMGLNEGFVISDTMHGQIYSVTVPDGMGFVFSPSGNATAAQLNTAGIFGEVQISTGTGAANFAHMIGPTVAIAGNVDIDVAGVFQVPTLSTAAQEFITNCGCFAAVSGGVITNGFSLVYDRLNKGVNLWAKTVSAGTSTATFTDTGIVVTAGRRYRWRIIRRAGDTAARFYVGSSADTFALVATHSANHPTADCRPQMGFAKVAGTTSVTAIAISSQFCDMQFPTRIAA